MERSRTAIIAVGVFASILLLFFIVLVMFRPETEPKRSDAFGVASTPYEAFIPLARYCDGARSPLNFKRDEFVQINSEDTSSLDQYHRERSFEYRRSGVIADTALLRTKEEERIIIVFFAHRDAGYCVVGITASSDPMVRAIAARYR